MRRMRQKISILKQTIRGLSTDVDAISSSSSDTNDCASGSGGGCEDDDENEEAVPLTTRRPKLGSYKKKTGVVAADAAVEKYQQRKLVEFEVAVDKLFHNALGTISINGAENSPNTKESRKRGLGAFKWVLERLMVKHPSLWANLLREKRTIQEAEKAAMAKTRKHWEDKGLNLFSRCGMTHRAWQIHINMTSRKWSTELQEFERILQPGGTPMCLHPSMHHILKQRE